jgi:hypothetical protein
LWSETVILLKCFYYLATKTLPQGVGEGAGHPNINFYAALINKYSLSISAQQSYSIFQVDKVRLRNWISLRNRVSFVAIATEQLHGSFQVDEGYPRNWIS